MISEETIGNMKEELTELSKLCENLKEINENVFAFVNKPLIEIAILNSNQLFSEPLVLNKNLFDKISELNEIYKPTKITIYASLNDIYHLEEVKLSQSLIKKLTSENYKELYKKTTINWVNFYPQPLSFIFKFKVFQESYKHILLENGFENFLWDCFLPPKLQEIQINMKKRFDNLTESKNNQKFEKKLKKAWNFAFSLYNNSIQNTAFNLTEEIEGTQVCNACGICCYFDEPIAEVSDKDAKTIEKEIKKLPKGIQNEIKLKAGSLENFWINGDEAEKLIPLVNDEYGFLTTNQKFHPCVFLSFPYKGENVPSERIGKCNIYDIKKTLELELCNDWMCEGCSRWTVKEHFKRFLCTKAHKRIY